MRRPMITRQSIACWFGYHAWETVEVDGCITHQKCVCGETQSVGLHSWGNAERGTEHPCHITTHCTKCPKVLEYDDHVWDIGDQYCLTCNAKNPHTGQTFDYIDEDVCGSCGRRGYGRVCPYCIGNYNR